MSEEVEDCLRRNGLVLTGNARAARFLRLEYAERRRRNGLAAWAAPNIRDWTAWLKSLWSDLLLISDDPPLLLSPLQEHALWKRIVQQHGDDRQLVSPAGVAELAQSAYALLSDYDAHATRTRSWDPNGSTDAEAFRRWAKTFDELCAANAWLSASALAKHALTAVKNGTVDPPSEILLVGFDRIQPAQQNLIDAFEARGTRLASLKIDAHAAAATPTLIQAKDPRSELVACAQWARKILLDRPDSRIGILVQDVAAVRGVIERTFRRILTPASQSIAAPVTAPAFEFSLGTTLATVPIVRSALLLLRWGNAPLPQEDVTWLLLSGFLFSGPDTDPAPDLMEVARFDASVRKRANLRSEIALPWLLRHTSSKASPSASTLRQSLNEARRAAALHGIEAAPGHPTRQSQKTYAEWTKSAIDILASAGWPGREKQDTTQYQARRKWEQVTDSIAALSFDGTRVDYQEFLKVLLQTTHQTIFSPQSQNAPIQIMGPMESAGQHCDAIWFLGVDDRQWPAKASTHPMVPLQVQREAAMPHASPDADWELARRITRRIAASAPECIFSYPAQREGGAAKVSPVLASALEPAPAVVTAGKFLTNLGIAPERRIRPLTVETTDESSILWPKTESAGGADILRRQAACPFQAFATRRLGARDLNDAERGLTPLDRGSILHDVLQRLWSRNDPPQWQLQSRGDLTNAIAEGRLNDIIERHVADALATRTDPEDQEDPWTTAYLAAEHERLCRLLSDWLKVEAARQPFTVEACEKELPDVQIGGLKLSLRIDRIDRIGSLDETSPPAVDNPAATDNIGKSDPRPALLIDYKTGKITPAAWQGDRPEEPQLPLYAAYGGIENVQGVLFAQIRPYDMRLEGRVANASTMLSSLTPSQEKIAREPYNPAMLEDWAQTLHSLAENFLQGDASVTPKDYPKTCKHCALPSLCRVADTLIPLRSKEVDEIDYGAETGGTYE